MRFRVRKRFVHSWEVEEELEAESIEEAQREAEEMGLDDFPPGEHTEGSEIESIEEIED